MSEKIDAVLPKTGGPLVNLMPTSTIQTANKAICATLLESPSETETDEGNNSETYTLVNMVSVNYGLH